MRRSLPAFVLVACSTEPPPPGAPENERVTVASLRDLEVGDCLSHGEALPGIPVALGDVVVTAVDAFDETGSGDVGTLYVEDPNGGPDSGISVFAPSGGADLVQGDVIEVDGELCEFELGQVDEAWRDENGKIAQITSARVRWTGEWSPPEPAAVSVADFSTAAEAEKWEGVLVRIDDAVAQGPPDEGSRVDLTARLQIDDDLYRTPDVTAGTVFASLTGVVSYVYTYKILPRSADDVAR